MNGIVRDLGAPGGLSGQNTNGVGWANPKSTVRDGTVRLRLFLKKYDRAACGEHAADAVGH
jgi:hypothetical protein